LLNLPTEVERRDSILQFVGQRQRAGQKTTKAIVIREMIRNKLASRQTTHSLIKELINEGKINMEVINPQVHFLTINYENEFIWINNTLADIYEFIDRCEKIRDKLQIYKEKNLPQLRNKQGISQNTEFLYFLFLQKFIPPIDAMLNRLLHRTILNIKSENDAQLLNKRIIDVIQKLYEMPLFLKSAPDLEDRLNIYSYASDRAINSGIDEINSNVNALKKQKQNLPLLPKYETLSNDFKKMADIYMKDYTNTLRALKDSQA
jgi:hypothetical protein